MYPKFGIMNCKQVVELIALVAVSMVPRYVLSQTCVALEPPDHCSCDFKDANGVSQGLVTMKPLDSHTTPLYNPCTAFSQPPGTSCADKAACQFIPAANSAYSTGTQESITYSVSGSDTVFTYQDAQDMTRTTIVTLKCDKSAVPARISVIGEGTPTFYNIDITTVCACPGACKDGLPVINIKEGLSTGSILCIVFFVVLIVYLITGALVNKYVRNKEGAEIVPNSGFWSDLPYLIKDGILFAISPCKKQTAYDQI
ncbi:uncharacterized protein LOC144434615 isoform X2 [Glandiceps talaboti]